MKMKIWFLFSLIITCVHSQELEVFQDTIYFKYDNKGLHPKELTFYKDSLSATEIYKDVKSSFEFANEVIIDFKSKITDEIPYQSFTLKGEFSMIFCVKGIAGPSCKDGSFEIDFIFRDGSYTMKPVKLKRIIDIELIPIEGRALFYKKDGTLKNQFSSFPTVVEKMLNWIAFFSSLTPGAEKTPQ